MYYNRDSEQFLRVICLPSLINRMKGVQLVRARVLVRLIIHCTKTQLVFADGVKPKYTKHRNGSQYDKNIIINKYLIFLRLHFKRLVASCRFHSECTNVLCNF